MLVGLGHGHAAEVDRADFLDIDGAVGRDILTDGVLAGAPDVDDDLIARTQTVVGRSGEVHARLEGEVFGVEDVASEHFVFLQYAGQTVLNGVVHIAGGIEHVGDFQHGGVVSAEHVVGMCALVVFLVGILVVTVVAVVLGIAAVRVTVV